MGPWFDDAEDEVGRVGDAVRDGVGAECLWGGDEEDLGEASRAGDFGGGGFAFSCSWANFRADSLLR